MGTTGCFFCKAEFDSTWINILSDRLANSAEIERIMHSPYLAEYGANSLELDLSPYLIYGNLICITYDNGFFVVYGFLRKDCDILVIRLLRSATSNKKRQIFIRDLIIKALREIEIVREK